MTLKRLMLLLVMLLLVAVLSACSSSEEKAQSRFDEALQLQQGGGVGEAEALYRRLIADYPQAPAAKQAQVQLDTLLQAREQALLKASWEAMESILQVVNGYREMYQRLPGSIKDIDNGEFFFDSDYMAESIPDGFSVYLALQPAGGYRIWSLLDGSEVGYVSNGRGPHLTKVGQAEAQKEIAADYVEEARKGPLTFLVPGEG